MWNIIDERQFILAMFYHKREQMARLLQTVTSAGPRMTPEHIRFLEEHLTPWASKRVRAEHRLAEKMKSNFLNKTFKIHKGAIGRRSRASGKVVRIRPAPPDERKRS